jgi:3-hydroxyacyl-[acyl-carrier-protein] dehydratase
MPRRVVPERAVPDPVMPRHAAAGFAMLDRVVAELFRESCRAPLIPARERRSGPWLEGEAATALIPHRPPFLFVDRITHVARTQPAPRTATRAPAAPEPEGTIVCRHMLRRDAPILAGHFPGRPLWPGVLQVEAIGQAGLCLLRLLEPSAPSEEPLDIALTDILAGRYLRPVVPDGEVEIVARTVRDGLFAIVVGQCLQEGLVCSAAAVRGIEKGVRA